MSESQTKLPKGLEIGQVKENLVKYGSNKDKKKDLSIIKIFFTTVFSVFNIVMGVLIIIMLVIGQNSDAYFIGIMAFFNAIFELFQNIRARLMVKKLNKLSEKTAKAVRQDENGVNKTLEIPITQLVVGDVVFLASGDRIPVDGEVLSSNYAEFDESILTGESDYLQKNSGEQILAGSFIVAGSCYYKITKLLKDSYIQKMTKDVENKEIPKTPLQSDINQIIKYLTFLTIFFLALLGADGLISEKAKAEIVLNSSVIVTSLVPQGLVLLTTLSFTYGAVKIAKQNAIAQKLSAIESMAGTKVVCMDKTGTLTKNELHLKEIKWL